MLLSLTGTLPLTRLSCIFFSKLKLAQSTPMNPSIALSSRVVGHPKIKLVLNYTSLSYRMKGNLKRKEV